MQISQINIFPVKSLDGFSPVSAVLTERGFEYDRRWMIIDNQNVFMTQRQFGKMALLRAVIDADKLKIENKMSPMDFIELCITPPQDALKVEVQVWDDHCEGVLVSTEANQWLSSTLGKECRLVYMPDSTSRKVDPNYNTGQDIVSFADAYPFLLIGEASLSDLNARLAQPISMRRFRPNIVFSGGIPYMEDSIKAFRIGEQQFLGVKPCARCVLTTRDPDTGHKGEEPLRTLTEYRQVGHKVLFGQNVIWKNTTTKENHPAKISVGMELVLLVQLV